MEDFKKKIKVLSSDLKYKGSILDVYQDTVDVSGHIVKWDRIKHHGAACVVPVMEDGRILLVRQYRHTIDRYTLELPAGKVEEGEEPKEAAIRELEEETGFSTDNIYSLCDIGTAYAYCDEVVYIYVAKDLKKGHLSFDTDEELKNEIYDIEILKNMIWNKEIKDSKTIAGIMSYITKENK